MRSVCSFEKSRNKNHIFFQNLINRVNNINKIDGDETKMADSRTLYEIPLYRMGNSNNWMKLPVLATSYESFRIETARSVLHFKDDDLKPNAEGKYIINIE